jgi:hypothetical protein
MDKVGFLGLSASSAPDPNNAAGSQAGSDHLVRQSLPDRAHDTDAVKQGSQSHTDIVALLEQHDREWRKAYHLVEEKRKLLCSIENELLDTRGQIDMILTTYQQTEEDLQTAMLQSDALDSSEQLASLFEVCGSMVQQLHVLGRALADVVERRRSVWEQYVQSIKEARRVLRYRAD